MQTLSEDLEELIDYVFDAVVPYKQYRVIRADDYLGCARMIVPVHELPIDYITPFSETDYDYQIAAIVSRRLLDTPFTYIMKCIVGMNRGHMLTTEVVNTLWAYTEAAEYYERERGYLPINMRAFVASVVALGIDEAMQYDY